MIFCLLSNSMPIDFFDVDTKKYPQNGDIFVLNQLLEKNESTQKKEETFLGRIDYAVACVTF